MPNIQSIFAREILDSRGNPTVEVEVSDGNFVASACVPSGASTGIHEALELRDGDKSRYLGKGVLKAVQNVNDTIAPKICEAQIDPQDQTALDQFMLDLDGTENKNNLGANAILGVSLAAARLSALQNDVPLFEQIRTIFNQEHQAEESGFILPRPMMNIINGGAHADSGLAIQEFMVFPKLEKYEDNLRAGAEIFHNLKKILSAKGLAVGVGDEGGFAPQIPTVSEALETIMEAIEKSGYKASEQIEIALDAAASEFYNKDSKLYTVDKQDFNAEDLTEFYQNLIEKYPITSIEDSHDEDDWDGFKSITQKSGEKCQLVGDDLFVTNKKRLEQGIDQSIANAILIKVNQIGTLTETLQTIKLAKDNKYGVIISHRSGETEDAFIADLAVGSNAGQIKTGSLSRSERIAKYNQLLRISEQI